MLKKIPIVFFLAAVTTALQAEDKCDLNNYRDYIFNKEKTLKLIETTGKGCQLRGAISKDRGTNY